MPNIIKKGHTFSMTFFVINIKMKFFYVIIFAIFIVSCSKENEIKVIQPCDVSEEISNSHSVEGYSDKNSYFEGDSVELKIHSLSPTIDINVFHYGANTTLVHSAIGVQSFNQNYNCRSYSFGCDWQTTYKFKLPNGLKSGIYSAHITNSLSESCYISFVVKSTSPNNNDILVLSNTNTWQAYNNWSGQSFYQYSITEEIVSSTITSFDRPNTFDNPVGNNGHLVNAELHLYRWLENKGYNFDLICDRDLHDQSSILNNYKLLILHAHPEYWTLNMYNNLISFLNNGGNLMYLGGNGIYWRVALRYNRIEVKKTGGYHSYDIGKGGKWRDIGLPESKYLGVEYTHPGINTFAPYEVLSPSHWIFTGTNVTQGQLIGETSLNNGKASGHETDKTTLFTPSNAVLLAKGKNPNNGGAHMVYIHNTQNNYKVFSVGSITYTGSLAIDSVISKITENVINDFIQ